MATNMLLDSGSTFRIKRPLITTSGFVSDVDPTVKVHLEELNTILGMRMLRLANPRAVESKPANPKETPETLTHREFPIHKTEPDLKDLLRHPLTPKYVPPDGQSMWDEKSLLGTIQIITQKHEGDLTLSDYIDKNPGISELKYRFLYGSGNKFSLDFNARTGLDGYPFTTDYLILYAYVVMEIRDVNGLKNFIFNHNEGVRNITNYACVSAARTLIDEQQIKVRDYNVDSSDFVRSLKTTGLSLSSVSFKKDLRKFIDNFVFNSDEEELINEAIKKKVITSIPVGIKPLLIKYIQKSPVKITKDNVGYFIPLFISQIMSSTTTADVEEEVVGDPEKDFDVQFLEDDVSQIQISISNVRCAAQLFYSMTLGDELDVFNVVNFFTHKYLIRDGLEIQDNRLRENLQMYVFSNKFVDAKTGRILDRTRAAERQMFYRQVFNYGTADLQIPDDIVVNAEYPRLWKVLMLESAKYIERAQESPNPDSYVSRQNVMQAVEDLQYNLSTHCTGMPNVITPIIYSELNFVIQKIFMHPEVLRQVVPAGGTWWRVVEKLHLAMKSSRPKATVLYNKAKLGYDILKSIATYNPATFEDDENFSAFISSTDAFITTQSILQESLVDDLRERDAMDESPRMTQEDQPEPMDTKTVPAANNGHDEWDF